MKNLVLLTIVGVLAGCERPEIESPQTMRVDDFEKAGEMHNSFLSNVAENMDGMDFSDPEVSAVQIMALNKAHIRDMDDPRLQRLGKWNGGMKIWKSL
jgi:SpoVK/Ycf46/Vps4 family AAA+-type ATPase